MLTSRTSNNEFSHKNDTIKTNKIFISIEDKEGKKYYTNLEKLFSNYRFTIVVLPTTGMIGDGNDPKHVFDRLVNHLNKNNIEVSSSNEDKDLNDSFWISIDLDHYSPNIHRIKDNFINFNDKSDKCYKMVISNPCFEVWKLFHIGKLYFNDDNKEVIFSSNKSNIIDKLIIDDKKNLQSRLKNFVNKYFKDDKECCLNNETVKVACEEAKEKFKNCNNCKEKFEILMNNIFATNMYEFINELEKYKK